MAIFLPNFGLRCLDWGGIYHFGDGRTNVKIKGTTKKLLDVLSLWFDGEIRERNITLGGSLGTWGEKQAQSYEMRSGRYRECSWEVTDRLGECSSFRKEILSNEEIHLAEDFPETSVPPSILTFCRQSEGKKTKK